MNTRASHSAKPTRPRRIQLGRVLALRALALSALALSTVALSCTANPPDGGPVDNGPIGTNQQFSGYVNGVSDGAVVDVVCTERADGSTRGRAIGGQIVAARVDPNGRGNTGDNGAIFVLPNTSAQFVHLQNWGEDVEFPTDIDIPCDGEGTIVFDPCFGFVGCRGGATADVVKVTFISVTP